MHRKFTVAGILLVTSLQNLLAQHRPIIVIDDQTKHPVSLTIVIEDGKGNSKQTIPSSKHGWLKLSSRSRNDQIKVKGGLYTANQPFLDEVKDTLYVHRIKYAYEDFLNTLNTSDSLPLNDKSVPQQNRHITRVPKPQKDVSKNPFSVVTPYKKLYQRLNSGKPLKNPSDFTSLFEIPISIPNDYFTQGTSIFETSQQYLSDITAFFLKNLPVRVIDIHVAAKCYFAHEGDQFYAWIYKSFQYGYDSGIYNVSGWSRLTISRISPNSRYRITAIDQCDDPIDNDADGIPTPFDKCPLTPPGTATDLDGCKKDHPHRKVKT